jgi:dTDP-glucose 4,6-dehydratase
MVKTVVVTGACGFIGHHVVEHFVLKTDFNIVVLDKLTYASKGYERLRSAEVIHNPRVRVFSVDLAHPITEGLVKEIGDVHIIIHMAANSHVDHSIEFPVECIQNNVMSTVHLLEYAKTLDNLERFFYFSTDEVFGPALGKTAYKEWDRHNPTNPYSASKSAAEQICVSYENTYKLPIMICNVMNVFGERQLYEKFIPLCIRKILNGETIDIHSYPGCQEAGTRFYIHARNVAAAVLFLLENGKIGEKYNITGEKEVSNLEMAQFIAKVLNKPLNYNMVDFHADRPGHDLRYSLDGSKMEKMGWKLPVNFEESLTKTIKWTLDNPEWLE